MGNELMVKEQNVSREEAYAALERSGANYGHSAKAFVNYLKEGNRPLTAASVTAYVESLDEIVDGKKFSANTFNTRISALKSMVRSTLKEFPPAKRYQVEEYLDSIKHKKVDPSVGPDDYFTPGEVLRLLEGCDDKRLRLMMEFLWATGCRISEMLNALLTDIKVNGKNVTIRILGKKKHERFLMIPKNLYERIVDEFQGKTWLFEHSGKTYSRVSVTQRVKYMSLKILGKEFGAHRFRHAFAAHHIAVNGYQKTASYLGHSSASTTLDMYGRAVMSWDDLEQARRKV